MCYDNEGQGGVMVFSSLVFLFIFLPINLILYYSVKQAAIRNWILIIFSLFFYAYGEPVWVVLLIFSATVDFTLGKLIEKHRGNWRSKAFLVSSLVVNLSLLGFFKYWNFLSDNVNTLLQIELPYHQFLLPIGISFYTFQTLSYSIDVYRGDVKAQQHYHKFLLFVSLFHQLVAGPIVRYKDIAKEIEHRELSYDKFSYGVNRFIQGLAKKVIIANTAGQLVNQIFVKEMANLSVVGAWLGITMFAFQIYFDFSGYSDMAIGLGRMFGFTYKENFDYPYTAKSATDFWRRWHISLGSFFRDYVYIPLGGNRKNLYRNIFVVWMLTGLWHGASWNFVMWGVFYGCLLLIEKLFLLKVLEKLPSIISHGYLLVAMLVGWVFFYFTSLTEAFRVIKTMFMMNNVAFVTPEVLIHLANNSLFIVIATICSTPLLKHVYLQGVRKWLGKVHDNLAYTSDAILVALVLLVATSLLIGDTYNPFLYFRF